MPDRGRLIALDGSGGPVMTAAAKKLQKYYKASGEEPGISRWDASGLFFDLLQVSRDLKGASPRTVLLLYAADLAFRLRWQIAPALEEGMTVIAAPYVETAVAFGRACGLQKAWVHELLEFAPAAETSYRVVEEKLPENKRGKPGDSFLEFCFLQMRRGSSDWITEDIRAAFLSHLKTLESRGKCKPASDKSLVKGA